MGPLAGWALILLVLLYLFKFYALWRSSRVPTETILAGAATFSADAVEDTISLSSSLRYLFGIRMLVRRNRELRRENGELTARLDNLRALVEENQRLRRMAGLKPRPQTDYLVAEVVGRNTDQFFSRLWIDRGSSQGLRVGQAVLSEDGALVGEVVALGPRGAEVRLITDPDFAAGAVTGAHTAAGVVQGNGSRRLDFLYLSPEAAIEVGDKVYTSGASGEIPRGLYIGRVIKVIKEPELERVRVEVAPAAQLDLLSFVLVVVER